MRAAISALLAAAALMTATTAATAHAQHCDSCEWTCEDSDTKRSYRRCMQRCMDRCYTPLPPDDEPSEPGNDQLIAVGILIAAIVFVAAVMAAIKRRRDHRISMHCMRVASALENEAAKYRAEAIHHDPDL